MIVDVRSSRLEGRAHNLIKVQLSQTRTAGLEYIDMYLIKVQLQVHHGQRELEREREYTGMLTSV